MNDTLKEAYRYQNERSYDKALACFRELCSNAECRETALLETAKTYKMMNLPSEAIDSFVLVLEQFPGNREAVRELGETARLAKQPEKAIETLESMKNPGRPDILLELARLYFQAGDYGSSLRTMENLDPDSADVRIVRGKIYHEKGDNARAAEEFEAALSAFPDKHEALSELGGIYRENGEYRKSLDLYRRCVTVCPHDKQAHLRLVELYALENENELSEQAAENAVRLAPDNPYARDAMLNEAEIAARKTVLRSKVKRLWVTVTTRCNIRCKTCGLWPYKWDLPYKTAREVMELYPYLERIVWLGGEVFLYEHFEEMFDAAAKHPNLRQQVITNGVILNETWMNKIVSTPNVELTFSVDGVTSEVYESIRQGSNFDKLVRNIRRVMELKREIGSKIDIRMNSLIVRSNYRQAEALLDFAHNEGFNQMSYLSIHLKESPEENIFYENRDPEIVRFIGEAIPRLREKAKRYNIDIDILLPPGELTFRNVVEGKEGRAEEPVPVKKEPVRRAVKDVYCTMPWKYMMICNHGNVLLTGSCVKSIGSINDGSLAELWNSDMARHYREKMIENDFEGLCRTECLSRWG